jgi:hypothetical protein
MARKQSPAALARSAAALASPDAVGGALGLRERLLEMAGVTEAEQAILTRRAIDTYVRHLGAKKVQRLVVNQGLNTSVVQEYVDEDLAIQARAADALLDRFGVVVSKTAASSTNIGSLTVHVHKVQPPELQQAVVLPVDTEANSAE